jgi:hypothetical protein
VDAEQIQKRAGSLEIFPEIDPEHLEYGHWLALSTPSEDPQP